MASEQNFNIEDNELLSRVWNESVDCSRCQIRGLALFSKLEQNDFNHIHSPIQDISFEQNAGIYQENEKSGFIYTIRSGLVKLESQQDNGAKKIVRLLRRGDVIGLEAILEETYHHTSIVLEPCHVCKIPVSVINELQKHSLPLCKELMTRWDKALFNADQWLLRLHTGQSRQRIIQLIQYLVENSESEPEFSMLSGEDMSSILHLTKETVSRILADLKRDKLISALGGGQYESFI